MNLLDILGTVNATGTHHQNTLRQRVIDHRHGVQQVLWTVGSQRGGWAHGAGQHHGLGGLQNQLQKPSGFFQCVGAVGDDKAANIALG